MNSSDWGEAYHMSGRKDLARVKFGTIEVLNYAGCTDSGNHARWFCYCSKCDLTFIKKGTCIRKAKKHGTVLCPQCYKKEKFG